MVVPLVSRPITGWSQSSASYLEPASVGDGFEHRVVGVAARLVVVDGMLGELQGTVGPGCEGGR
ncbi:hypothetical protein [Streptomyces sp. NPDC059639]|uniref:hypothetical protein n=1 Tax=Streptomyces sp. NPDC059639 TaxID=3346891 RepID=UPI0036BDB049